MTEDRTSILVVDDDPDLRTLVSAILEPQGHVILQAADGEEALAIVETTAPSLVITDVDMPRMDGWCLVRTLRARPGTAFTPVIFLTVRDSCADRVLGYRLGGDDYVPKPVQFDELKLRVRNVLRHATAARASWGAQQSAEGVSGSLQELGLCTLLMMFGMERKTGTLRVARAGDKATLVLRDGRILRAHFDSGGAARNRDCVFTLLRWSEGAFQFATGEVQGGDDVQMSTDHLLMEGARLVDEAGRGP